jgi:hypothetical protein
MPHLFYTNILVQKHNKFVLNKTIGLTFNFEVTNIHYHSYPSSYKLLDDPSKTIDLHIIIHIKQDMVVELCVGNYATYDCLVNGVNGVFETSTFYHNKTIVCILFPNPKIEMLTSKKSTHLYTNNIQPNWTPIEPIIKDIRIGKNQFRIIKKFNFQFIPRIIHQSQGLSLDKLAFDLTKCKKTWTNIYYSFLQLDKRRIMLITSTPISNQHVIEKMNRLKTFANRTTFVLQFKNFYHSHVIIQALNTNFLKQQYQYINHDPNLYVSHVFCILEAII